MATSADGLIIMSLIMSPLSEPTVAVMLYDWRARPSRVLAGATGDHARELLGHDWRPRPSRALALGLV